MTIQSGIRIALIAAASIALGGTANACKLGVGCSISNEDHDRYVRQVEHEKRMQELNNSILKAQCLNLQLSIQNAGGQNSQQGNTIRRIMNDEINKCRAKGLW